MQEDQKRKRIDRVIEYGIDLYTTSCVSINFKMLLGNNSKF